MVDLRVLPSNGLRGNYAIWRGNEGKQFALQIGRTRRELLTRFVVRKTTGSAPVDVSICLLDRIRPSASFLLNLGDNQKVGFVVGQFFLLIAFDVLKTCVQDVVCGKNYEPDEMLDLIFPETIGGEM